MAKDITRSICTVEYKVTYQGKTEDKKLVLGETIPMPEKILETIAKTFTKVMSLFAKVSDCKAHLNKYSMSIEKFIEYADEVEHIETKEIL